MIDKLTDFFITFVFLLLCLFIVILNIVVYILPFFLAFVINIWWICSMIILIPMGVIISKIIYWFYKFIQG